MDNHNHTSKDNFQREVKSLLQQIDQQIQTHSTHMGANQNTAQNKNSRIEKLNTLKI